MAAHPSSQVPDPLSAPDGGAHIDQPDSSGTALGTGTGTGPERGSGWVTADQLRAQQTRSARLPWALVALLTALCLVLGGILFAQSREIARLRTNPAPQAGVPATPDPGATQGAAAPTPNPAATASAPETPSAEAIAVMKKLPHRKAGDPLALGKVDAPVVMVVWSDFRCPYCSVWSRDTLPQLQPYIDSGSLRVEHRDMVLFGDQSLVAAKGARAAANQGKFWQYYHAVHDVAPTSGHPTITEADVKTFATKAGVPDMARFQKDYASSAVTAAIATDNEEARQIGLTGTPFFVINTTAISGAQPLSVFTQVIESYGGTK